MKCLILCSLFCFLFSCASKPTAKPSPQLVTEQKIERLEPETEPDIAGQLVQGTGYEITYPAGWELIPRYMGTDTLARSMATFQGDDFLENISVVFEATVAKNASDYYQLNLPSMKSMLPKFTIVSSNSIELSDGVAIDLLYTHASQNIETRNRAVFLYRHGVGYVITTTSTPESFEEYYDTFDEIIRSFKFQ